MNGFHNFFVGMEVIRQSKSFFGTNVMIGISLITLYVLWNSLTPEKGSGFQFPEEYTGILLPLAFLSITFIVLFAKDEFILDFDNRLFSNHIRLAGIRFFREEQRLPRRIVHVLVIRSVKQWKRYIAVAIPFTTNLLVYEVFLLSTSGKLIRLFSTGEEQAERISLQLAELYQVPREYREVKGIRTAAPRGRIFPGRGSRGLPPRSG
jgi:hypothetical protein